ncbi:unnamed protein product, partial [Sphenostylis stenocarpa]
WHILRNQIIEGLFWLLISQQRIKHGSEFLPIGAEAPTAIMMMAMYLGLAKGMGWCDWDACAKGQTPKAWVWNLYKHKGIMTFKPEVVLYLGDLGALFIARDQTYEPTSSCFVINGRS